jgi:crotonobetainyl-CoA:carnitine CoA-transferase CaiB-like acyl-CoA transferase
MNVTVGPEVGVMRPLEGYRVVELGIWVAGPAAASMLGEWGADVVKVEPPAGDPNRFTLRHVGVDARSPAFDLDNRDKHAMVLDLKDEAGRKQLDALLSDADVFVTNLRPGALERLGLDPPALRRRFPRLVVATLTSYGWSGPMRDRPGFDVSAFWAASGLSARLLPPGEAPPAPRPAMGDRVAATALVAGVAAALLARVRTGEGDVVDVSLLRAGMYCNGSDLSIQQAFGRRSLTRPRDRHESPLYNCYRTADGRWLWLVALEGDRHWAGLAEAVGGRALAQDERFAGSRERRRHAGELIAELDAIFGRRTLAEWAGLLDAADVWWAPVLDLPDVVESAQAHAAGGWVAVPGQQVRSVAGPVGFWGADVTPRRAAPDLGADTDDVLARLRVAHPER